MNPNRCTAPDGTLLVGRTNRRMLAAIEGDVARHSALALHAFLVADAVKRKPTDLRWAVAAYGRIGELTKKGAEAAYQAVLDEVEVLTGLRMMPV